MTARATQARREQLVRDLTTPGKLMPPLSVGDTALVLQCSRWTVRRKINERKLRKERGKIPAYLVRTQLSPS